MGCRFSSLFLSLELQTFCVIVLCVLNHKSVLSIEAALKYFLLSAFSSCLMLLGMSLLYATTGTADFSFQSTAAIPQSLPIYVSYWLMTVALLWKLSAAPLHSWAADVYQGISSPMTLFLSTLPKLAVLCFWANHWQWESFNAFFPFFITASLLFGAFSAIGQTSFKRFLAYSSIAQIGFLLMPLSTGNADALLTYVVIYLLTSFGLWGVFLWPSDDMKGVSTHKKALPLFLRNFKGLNQSSPEICLVIAILFLSLAGLPPFAGFLGKVAVLTPLITTTQYVSLFAGLFSTAVSTFYYVRMVRFMVVPEADVKATYCFQSKLSPVSSYSIVLLVLSLCLLLWVGSPLLAYHAVLAG
jgi:NADH-quinone oxidoreductase subunit N